MSDFAPSGPSSRTGPPPLRPGPSRPALLAVGIVAALAFLVGLVGAVYVMRARPGWFGNAPATEMPDPAASPSAGAAPLPAYASPAPAVAAVDPETLATRESVLAAQLAALEARTASVSTDVASASGQAGRAEAMLVAFAARRAIDRGLQLGGIEGQLRTRFAATQPRATQIVTDAARAAPVTAETLRAGLDLIGTDMAGTGQRGFFTSLRRELGNMVVVHKVGTPSPLPADRLARARRLLDGGQVDTALAEVSALPVSDQTLGWRAAAQRYIDTHHALDALESAALLGQTVANPPAATPPGSR